MNCPSCGARLHLEPGKDSMTCDYCKCLYLPEKQDDGVRVLGEPSGERCPVCSTPLMHAALAKVRIRYCTQCRGMLIPMDPFMALVDELRSLLGGTLRPEAPDPRALKRNLDCPGCRHRMDTHFYAGPGNVIIDSCDRCSLNWLDSGELMRIVHAPDSNYEG